MPNTLAHAAVNLGARHFYLSRLDPKITYIGLVIPDLPWIMQRVLSPVNAIDPYLLRAYCITQASLVFCLLIAAAVSVLSQQSKSIFCVLTVGVLLHLGLDMSQEKWANGVHLLVPFSWVMVPSAGLWPENWVYYTLSALGLVALLVSSKAAFAEIITLRLTPWRIAIALMLSAAVLIGPWLLESQPFAADNHYLQTLKSISQRTGRPIVMDRVPYSSGPGGVKIETFANERLTVVGEFLPSSAHGLISLEGRFLDPKTIIIDRVHEHHAGIRNLLSLLGISMIMVLIFGSVWRSGVVLLRT